MSAKFTPSGSYTLPEPAGVETCTPFGERFRLELDAGRHTPKNELEEQALEHLVTIGLAERVEDGKPAAPRAKATKSSED